MRHRRKYNRHAGFASQWSRRGLYCGLPTGRHPSQERMTRNFPPGADWAVRHTGRRMIVWQDATIAASPPAGIHLAGPSRPLTTDRMLPDSAVCRSAARTAHPPQRHPRALRCAKLRRRTHRAAHAVPDSRSAGQFVVRRQRRGPFTGQAWVRAGVSAGPAVCSEPRAAICPPSRGNN